MKIKGNIPLVDLWAVASEFTKTEEARSLPIQASIYLDDTAPTDLAAFVRSNFASAAPNARITISYLGGARAIADPEDDIAVIVAGEREDVGQLAHAIREVGVPAMVVTTSPQAVARRAEEAGYALPSEDVLAPDAPLPLDEDEAENSAESVATGGLGADADLFGASADAEGFTAAPVAPAEPIALGEDEMRSLESRMGTWIVSVRKDKRLAYAAAFPFVRRPLAMESVNLTAIQNAGIGVVVFIPGADMPIMTLNQVKMVLQIAAAYGEPLDSQRIKELVVVAANALVMRGVARKLISFVPGVGFLIKGGVGFAATIALGRAIIEYFENGGGIGGLGKTIGSVLTSLAKTVEKSTGAAQPEPEPEKTFAEAAEEKARLWGNRAKTVAGMVGKTAGPLASGAAKVGADTFSQGIKQILH